MAFKGIVYVLCFTLVLCKYSYTDKCYRYSLSDLAGHRRSYQIYTTRKGKLLSSDFIADKQVDDIYFSSFYYHYVLDNCEKDGEVATCIETCESVWFKLLDVNHKSSKRYVEECDPIFQEKYADITKHNCTEKWDPFVFLRQMLGQQRTIRISYKDGVPLPPVTEEVGVASKCVWEWDILGLVSLVTVCIIASIVVVSLIIFIIMIAMVQKHRSNKRKRLENSLIHETVKEV